MRLIELKKNEKSFIFSIKKIYTTRSIFERELHKLECFINYNSTSNKGIRNRKSTCKVVKVL